MEAFLLMCDTAALALLVWTSLRNDRRGPNEPQSGLFRYRESAEAPKDPAPRYAAHLRRPR